MNFDAAAYFTAQFWWGFFCLIFGIVSTLLIIFAPAPLAAWLQFHVPWLWGAVHNGVICPNGFVCTKS